MKFDKSSYGHKWPALLAFLEEVYDRAVQEKLLLASYSPPNREKKASAGVFASKVEEHSDNSTGQVGAGGGNLGTISDAQKKRLEQARTKLESVQYAVQSIPSLLSSAQNHGLQTGLFSVRSLETCLPSRELKPSRKLEVVPGVLAGHMRRRIVR